MKDNNDDVKAIQAMLDRDGIVELGNAAEVLETSPGRVCDIFKLLELRGEALWAGHYLKARKFTRPASRPFLDSDIGRPER